MIGEYWAIHNVRGAWLGVVLRAAGLAWVPRINRHRYTIREHAVEELTALRERGIVAHITHVRIRPRSERVFLAERVRAWEATVKAAQEHEAQTRVLSDLQIRCTCDMCLAVRAIPKEHRV